MFGKLNIFTSAGHRQKKQQLLPMHTDVHTHLIPGIDDGADNAEQAADLALELEQLGIRQLVLTPHVRDEVFPNTPATIDPALNLLRSELERRGSGLRLSVSAEYRVDNLLYDQLKQGLVRPLPSNYLLIECGWLFPPSGLEAFARELMHDYGLKPILAHPERYPYYQQDTAAYTRLHSAGLLFQVNILSLAGHYGSKVRSLTKELVESKMVEFVATDLHNTKQLQTIKEYLNSREYNFLLRHSDTLLNDSLFTDI